MFTWMFPGCTIKLLFFFLLVWLMYSLRIFPYLRYHEYWHQNLLVLYWFGVYWFLTLRDTYNFASSNYSSFEGHSAYDGRKVKNLEGFWTDNLNVHCLIIVSHTDNKCKKKFIRCLFILVQILLRGPLEIKICWRNKIFLLIPFRQFEN